MRLLLTILCCGSIVVCFAQSFPPAASELGSTAIYKDSSIIVYWAESPNITRGWLDIADKSLGFVSHGEAILAGGKAEGDGSNVVSLGDSGIALYSFTNPIIDGPGPDFAVFENGFADNYMEFAFVEVSSDGEHFVRFPATSETPVTDQMSNFTYGDCRMINNLAGKYRQGYGTPFDLSELSGLQNIDLQSITHVRLIDVIGSIANIGSVDQYGTPINDPYPSPFPSGGFDLDALAVIHAQVANLSSQTPLVYWYPNPVQQILNFGRKLDRIEIYTLQGSLVGYADDTDRIDVVELPKGMYAVKTLSNGLEQQFKIIKE